MTVAQLIRTLEAMPQDAVVEISYEATGTDQIRVLIENGRVLLEDDRERQVQAAAETRWAKHQAGLKADA